MKCSTRALALLFPLVMTLAAAAHGDAEHLWGQWRGPLAAGVAPHGDPPLAWSENDNVRWKRPLPGRGHASPIVWEDRVYVLSAVPAASGDSVGFTVLAIDRATGDTVWERVARTEVPHEGTHPDGSWASNSAVCDGERLYADFGSRGLYAYDLDGTLAWSVDLGDMSTRRAFGEGSSPVVAGDALIVNWDHEGSSFIVALDKSTGRELWRRDREEQTSWATPLVVEADGRLQVVVNATGRVRSYDVADGSVVWEVGGQTVNAIPSPVHGNGLVYAMSGFRASALKAIRLVGAEGDLTGSEAVAWSYDRDTPYVPSPLLYDDQLYFLKVNSGILTSLDATTGAVRYGPQRLPGIDGVYASPVGAAGKVYLVGRNGTTVVLRHGPTFEVLAENVLDDSFSASPAVVGNELFLRGHEYLYCLAEDASAAAATSAAGGAGPGL